MPNTSAEPFLPVSMSRALKSANSFQASAMPSFTACRISGERRAGSKVFPPSIPSFAKRSRSTTSDGCNGQNPSTKARTLKNAGEVRCSSTERGATKSILGAAGGGGLPRNCDNVWTR